MKRIEDIITTTLNGKVWQSAFFRSSRLSFLEEVVAMCKQNYCGMYGKTWTCPPGVGDLAHLKAKCLAYENAFVFTTKHDLEDSFDIDGMDRAREIHAKIERELQTALSGQNFLCLGAGACNVCKTCTYPTAPCRFPGKAKTSMEACGISVVDLAKEVNVNYVNGANTVTYFSLILY